MKVEDLKWYSPFILLVGAILSFADPITDILTLVDFYRADHKTWFGVGLAFIILPCLPFPVLYSLARRQELSRYSDIRRCTQTILCGFHPFSAAFARLQGFVFCMQRGTGGCYSDDLFTCFFSKSGSGFHNRWQDDSQRRSCWCPKSNTPNCSVYNASISPE